MHVALVIYESLATTSGGYLYDRKFVSHLRDRGDTVDVISLPRPSYPRGLLHNLSPAITKRLSHPDVDVLLQDELCHPSLFWSNRRLRSDLPIVTIVHHLRSKEPHEPLRNRVYREIERGYLRSVDGAICTSHATRDDVDRLRSRELPGMVAYPGPGRFEPDITVDEIDGRAHEAGPLRILFVGHLAPRKGVTTLLRGVDRLPTEGWELTIVGDRTGHPGYVTALEREVARLGLDDRVEFTGQLPDSALEAEFRKGHLFAVPSTYEGFGIAYLEAMGFGLPPIATTEGGPREFIVDSESGYLLPPGDPDGLAETIRPLMADRSRLATLGRAARQRFTTHPTWGASMEKARRFLTQVVGDPTTGRNSSVPE